MTDKDSQLHREIGEQPQVLRRLLETESDQTARVAAAIRARNPKLVVIAARGTSDNAARFAQYLFGATNALPVALATPSLFTLYKRPPNLQDSLVLGISQSGASPDINSVIREGARQGAMTVAVTNDPQSTLAATAEHTIEMHAGQEHSIAATKTYTASLLAMAMLSTALAGDSQRERDLWAVPDLASQVVRTAPDVIQVVERYRYMRSCVVVGRGYNYATAFEIALKLKELAYVLADPYSPADFEHGPIALIEHGFPVLAVAPEGQVLEGTMDFLRQMRQRQAELIVISAVPEALRMAKTALSLPAGIPEWLSPIVGVISGQLFALGLTLAKDYDPDHPRGLRKVTLTH